MKEKLEKLSADHRRAVETVKRERVRLKKETRDLKASIEAQKVIQTVAARTQQEAHDRIAGIVTRCLRAVFGSSSLPFKIDFVQKRGKTEATLTFADEKGRPIDPNDGSAGGEIDVAAFALRVAAVMFQRPARRRLLVLDEPFKMVSKEYVPALAELIEKLSDEVDFQFVIVTHSEDLQVGKVIKL